MKTAAPKNPICASQLTWPVGEVDLIVPVYKNKNLVARCINSISVNIDEISANSPRLIVVNDSPDDSDVTEYLRNAKSKGTIDLLIENSRNIGFVKSVNKALSESKKRLASAILINSDTETFEGTLAEMIAVADLDDQFAFVCPRSNNASLCTFPMPPHVRSGSSLTPQSMFEDWDELKDLLPRYSYAPTAIGFYMLIKSVIIRNFEPFDERFGAGYEEENDLVMRAGKVGFRAVLANHSFAYHAGSASFTLTDIGLDDHKAGNLRKMNELHPEFLPNMRSFESSAEFRAESILKGLLRDSRGKLDIAFVLLSMGRHDETNEFIVNVIKQFVYIAKKRYNITLLCDPATAQFHGLDRLLGARVTSRIDRTYAMAFSFCQPNDLHTLNVMEMIAPVVVYSMLDVISLDSGPLRHSQNVSELWEYVAETSNGIIFISQFSTNAFLRRFPTTTAIPFTRLLSTRTSCYAEWYRTSSQRQSQVLVVGNRFDQKDSTRVGKHLANAFPSLSFLVSGPLGDYPPNAQALQSGTVGESEMVQAICESSVIVLPSFYEGFGFTFMHALAAGKPVVARDIPATREIIEKFDDLTGVYLFSDDAELQRALAKSLETRTSSFSRELGDGWLEWTEHLATFLDGLIAGSSNIHSTVVKRIKQGDHLRNRVPLASTQNLSGASPLLADANGNFVVSWKDWVDLPAEHFVNRLYEQILGREADDVGMLHHLKLLNDGRSRPELVAALLESQEYRESRRKVRIEGLSEALGDPKSNRHLSTIWRWFRNWLN